MTRVRTRVSITFAGLALLCWAILAALAVPMGHLASPNAGLLCFLVPFALVVIALLALQGLGCLPAALCSDRPVLAGGALSWAVGTLILWAASDGSGHGLLLAVLAGCFCGVGAAACAASWLARLPERGTTAFACLLFGPVAAGAVLSVLAFTLPAAALPLALAAGVGSCALGLAAPSLKNIPRGPGFSAVARQARFFAKLVGCTALWAASVAYSMRHFFPMVLEGPAWVSPLGIAGAALVMLVVALVTARLSGKPVGPFSVVKAYPILLAVGIIPLEYLGAMAPLMQPTVLAGLFAATVALCAFLAWECAAMSGANPLVCLAAVLAAALVGTAVAFWCEGLVGLRTDTVFWAVAPLLCLVASIVVCDFWLTGPSLAKSLVSGEADAAGAFAASRLGMQCRAVARDHDLTSRELEVLDLLVQGYSLAYVCEKLVIAQGTATTHKQRIYKKLGVHTKNELIELVSGTAVDSE